MPRSLPLHSRETVAHAACSVSDLLEVLWGRGHEAAPSGPLPPSQFRALTVIKEQRKVNQRTLGEVLGSRPSAVSRLCDRLEAAGLIERLPSTTSRREVQLRLSRRGSSVLEEFRTLRVREVEAVLETMSPAHLATLSEGLNLFQEAAAEHIGLPSDAKSNDGPSAVIA
ncbi:MarR family transcriptional regulator [Streptomyces durmitorensis]|uniref:MarR family transcriptional regulator n=1 Tax=Streptomyces durmitorensis TaxID=319947 RepID=A0ABY4PQG9_9ACTN|nr:MarR family transcriptional regulator [Streptomyces durmitorensis]UQT55362.1 MarR family transcriptional regulator [Streptomyces durmitorensis]